MKRLIPSILFLHFSFALAQNEDLEFAKGNFGCRGHAENEDFIKTCFVEVNLNVKPSLNWTKLACYGEIEFSEVSAGDLKSRKKGFLISANQVDLRWPKSFLLREFVYFPYEQKVVGPRLV